MRSGVRSMPQSSRVQPGILEQYVCSRRTAQSDSRASARRSSAEGSRPRTSRSSIWPRTRRFCDPERLIRAIRPIKSTLMTRTTATAALLFGIAIAGATLTATAASPLTPASAEVQAQAREIYRTIIGFETVAGKGQVPVMARYLAEKFRSAGFPSQDIHILPLGETASLIVRYAGDGTGGKPILLLAHMDVVVAKREDWTRDPFTLVEENGYFFGRGTSDIKGDIALITTTFLRLKREGFKPRRDLVIVFTGDEETHQDTTRDLTTTHRALIDAEFALNADGGGGRI